MARKSGATVLNLPHNLGIGGAVRAGYAFAEERGYLWIVRLDGDGQHDAKDIIRLLEPVQQNHVDAAFGSRYCGTTNKHCSSRVRRWGIWIYGIVVSLIIKQRITDATSGFWCLNRKAIRYFTRYFPQDYPEVESHILLYKAGFRQMEVPVNMYARVAGHSSIDFYRSIYYAFKVLLAAVIRAIQDAPQMPEEESYGA
jgi:glycosyltransferase involved in cell wall biosynthesis